jgi:penicillin amidase
LAEALHGKEDMAIFTATWEPWALISRDIDRTPQDQLAKATVRAVKRATAKYKRFSNWGAMHRLRLAHPFGSIPRIGRRYRFGDHPVSGSNETVMKTAHGFAAGRHSVRLGAIARHISEMGEPDANYFVLLGGQDGWLGSTASTDLTALWRRGSYVQVPLRAEVALNRLQHRTVLMP